jgi:hypothetical protein
MVIEGKKAVEETEGSREDRGPREDSFFRGDRGQ